MVNPVPDLQAFAARVNTGTADAETSRALVVFNLTDQPLDGVAVFEATMTWPVNALVPFVAVTDADGNTTASDMVSVVEGADPKGRADKRLLSFRLHFGVSDVPAHGWRTYVAYLAGETAAPSEIAPPDPEGLDTETPGLQVVETTRHEGDLPATGTF